MSEAHLERTSADLPPELARVLELSDRGRLSRVGFTGLGYLLGLFVAPWWVLACGFALVLLWEFKAGVMVGEWLVSRPNDPDGARRLRLLAITSMPIGSVIFALLPTVAASAGTLVGVALACVWVAASAMHVYVYHSRNNVIQVTTLGPCLLMVGSGFMFAFGPSVEAFAIMACLLVTLAAANTFAIDRNKLLDEIAAEKSARLAAEAADKAKMQFLSVMSHELRTPLNAVIGYAELMRDDIDDGQKPRRDDAGRIISAGQHLLALINEVLDMARLEADMVQLREERVEAGALLREVGAMLAPMAAKNYNTLDIAAPATAVNAMLDRQRVMQCVLNLGSNACKFTKNGAVRIALEVQNHDDAHELVFTISDNGCGIADADLARLFQPFQQVHGDFTRPHDGAGLGLAITRKLARRMGGEVTAQSTPGVGSTFTVRVPFVPAMPQALAA